MIVSSLLYSQNSKTEKIIEMIDISQSSNRFDLVLNNLIEIEKSTNTEIDNEFWTKFESILLDSLETILYKDIAAIYDKYLTEDEVDDIIAFYKSKSGQRLIEQQAKIIQESMDLGKKLGEDIAVQIFSLIQIERKEKFDIVYSGCKDFHTGTFYAKYGDYDIIYNRTKNKQTEKVLNTVSKYDIKWINECKYTLELISSDDPIIAEKKGEIVIVNIISCRNDGYSFLAKLKNDDFIINGEMTVQSKQNTNK